MSPVPEAVRGQLIQQVPISAINLSMSESQQERRNHFDPKGITELADSLKSVGLLAPIVVVRCGAAYDLVAGERRLMAAKKAGWADILCSIRELTDAQILKVQLVENLQREDLHELAEAEAYEALIKCGLSIEEIAAETGKSKATIYARMKLTALTKACRRAFYDGKLNASTALLLARIPADSLQNQALKEITEPKWGDALNFREASEHIHETYMTKLSSGGFPTEDPDLVPKAGPCGACPKRTGNQKELFGDVKAGDVCTDTFCFALKRSAHGERLLAKAKADGKKVITGPAAKKIFHGHGNSMNGYAALDEDTYQFNRRQTVRQALGKDFVPELIQHPVTGAILEVASNKVINAAAKKLNPQTRVSSSRGAAEKKAKAERLVQQTILTQLRAQYPAALGHGDLEALALTLVREMQRDTLKRLFALWNLGPAKNDYGFSYEKAAAKLLAGKSGEILAKFLLDCILVSEMQHCSWTSEKPTRLFAMAARDGIDVAKIRRDAAPKPKAKKKPAAKRK